MLECSTDHGSRVTFTENDRNTIRIRNNMIYQHHTARINYTTYDVRRDYDTINPRTHPFVMVPSAEADSASCGFSYAMVLGIFHTEVQHIAWQSSDLRPKVIDFLWVRWFEPVRSYSFGRKQAKLPKIHFCSDNDDFTFGFLDPSLVLRGCHLIPAFADGKKSQPLTIPTTSNLKIGPLQADWYGYYVGM